MIDPKLIHEGVRNRDPAAEAELAAFLKGLVWKAYQRTLGPLAEDYMQELAMRVFEAVRAGKVNDPEKLIPFCLDVAKNIRIDALRVAVRQARKLVAIDEARFEAAPDNAEADELLAQQFRTILKLMERLDPFSREVVRRYYFEQQTPAEIEQDLDLAHQALQRVKDNAVEKLRRDYRALSDAQGWQLLHGRKQKPEGKLRSYVLVAAAA